MAPKATYPEASISTRSATIRQFSQVQRHLKDASIILLKVKEVYEERFPVIGAACDECVNGISMVSAIAEGMREAI